MSIRLFSALSAVAFICGMDPSCSIAAETAEAKPQLPMSLEEIATKRKAVREQTMLPSLTGIKGIAYRVVGYKDYKPLETLMGNKLEQLSIKKIALMNASGSPGDCDAVVQITFSKAGAHTIAELKVTQWVSLVRDPKTVVRAVTYSDKLYSVGFKPEQSVDKLTEEFVVDILKANQKGFAGGDSASKAVAAPAKSDSQPKKK